MLFRGIVEPIAAVSKQGETAETGLFPRLEELARNRPFLLDCSVQQLGDDDFVAVLSDHESGAEVCAWSSSRVRLRRSLCSPSCCRADKSPHAATISARRARRLALGRSFPTPSGARCWLTLCFTGVHRGNAPEWPTV